MDTRPQRQDGFDKVAKLVKDMRIAMLTTRGDEGQLAARPMSALRLDEDGCFWFFTAESSAKAHQLENVNLAFTDEDDATYVSICGHGEIVRDRARIDELWTPAAKPWFPNGKDDPDLVLLKVVPDTIEYWDSNASRMVRMAQMAASIVARRPVGLGDHGRMQADGASRGASR